MAIGEAGNMVRFGLNFDMRAPDFGAPAAMLYASALQMAKWADAHGFDFVSVQEHHGAPDGYMPSPFLLGAALAVSTVKMRIQLGAVILPLHDPVDIAEQIAVLDLISGGRLEVVLGAGYVEREFAMFKVSTKDRAKSLDEGIEVLQRALAGERFTLGGREIFIRPLPVQKPYPPLFAGGKVAATAKRAARFGINLYPLKPDIVPIYVEECRKLGRVPGQVIGNVGWVHVSDDPEATWAQVAPHVAHVARSYAEWGGNPNYASLFKGLKSVDDVKASGTYRVVTPQQCLAIIDEADKAGRDVGFAPLIAGLDPKIGWKGLELFAQQVLPIYRSRQPAA
jgi:alkanesulfonate monooxygenase SsuD/methylene tetrahydromethanopterin reductase-like flavin-dependent oxidoreductase (luciferase family)